MTERWVERLEILLVFDWLADYTGIFRLGDDFRLNGRFRCGIMACEMFCGGGESVLLSLPYYLME